VDKDKGQILDERSATFTDEGSFFLQTQSNTHIVLSGARRFRATNTQQH
jgi:hypothetical protein